MTDTRSGGCLCGAVRYEIPWPPLGAVACHCTHCQKQSGSALSTIVVTPRAAFKLTGALTIFVDSAESGGTVTRKFCGTCGSPIISDLPGAQHEAVLYVKSGTLDDTSGITPSVHLWTSSAQHWFPFPEGVPKVEKQ